MSKNLSAILRSGSNTPTVANSDIPALANPSTGYLNWTGIAYAETIYNINYCLNLSLYNFITQAKI